MLKGDQIEARADQLRRQAGDLVEGLLSLILAGGNAPSLATPHKWAPNRSLSVLGSPVKLAPGGSPLDNEYAPLLSPATTVKAGDVARFPMTVTNDSPSPVDVTFYSSDLVGDSGFGIPARKVVFSPRMHSLQPKEATTFEVSIPVPPQTPMGTYTGVIQAAALEHLRALVTVPVE